VRFQPDESLPTIAIADYQGPVYLRFGRPEVAENFTAEDQKFEIGKHRCGRRYDVSLFACGHMVWLAVEAAKGAG